MTATQGPWRFEESTWTIRAVPSNYWLASMDSWDGAVDHDANARLIAAAPDLLTALKAAEIAFGIVEDHGALSGGQMAAKHKMDPFEGYGFVLKHSRPAAKAVRAALAKAEGRDE